MKALLFVEAGAVLLGLGMVCATNAPLVPGFVETPAAVYPQAEALFRVTTTVPGGRDVVYVLDWGDGTIDTTNGWPSGDTVTVRHTWQAAGGFAVKALAFVQDEPGLASEWSEPLAVTVLANGVPQAYGLEGPERTVPGAWAKFRARATDSDGDSVAVQYDFNGTIGAWSAFGDTGAAFVDSFKFSAVETVEVRCRARDQKGSVSGWSDSVSVAVDEAGSLLWVIPDMMANGPPMVTLDGADEVIYVVGDWYLYGINGGQRKVSPGLDWTFSLFPAFCVQTGHVVIGCDDGGMHAYTPQLVEAWFLHPDTVDNVEWNPPAVSGNRIYACREEHSGYWVFCIEDTGTGARVVGKRGPYPDVFAPPVVAADGGVLLTDGRWLHKLAADLDTVLWSVEATSWDIVALALGPDGSIYCGDDHGAIAALDPDGVHLWQVDLAGAITGLVVGDDGVFANTDEGWVSRVDFDGEFVWEVSPSEVEPDGTPILTTNGLLYVVDCSMPSVCCMDRADGEVLWTCECGIVARAGRGAQDDVEAMSAAILRNGNIVFADDDALYCVKGYEDGGLDTDAPWPKWQHDGHNTGSAGD